MLDHAARLAAPASLKFHGATTGDKAGASRALNREAPKAPSIYALERYTGVLYQYLDYPALKRKEAARKRIFIVSGLFGLIAGGTKIPRYKMPMNPWLARHWRPVNSARLAQASGRRKVLCLLPQAYAKAINAEGALCVDFRIEGGRKAAGHAGKAIKGKFVRFLIENNVCDPMDFDQFQEDGFQFDGANFVQQ